MFFNSDLGRAVGWQATVIDTSVVGVQIGDCQEIRIIHLLLYYLESAIY